MIQDPDDKFFDRADAHIDLANAQTKEIDRGKVSASFMYSLARFNAWIAATGFNNSEHMKEHKEELKEYFVTEYKKMLSDNLDDYISNFNKFLQIPDK